MDQREAEVVLHLPPCLGDDLRADAQQAGLAILFCAMVIDRIVQGALQALDFAPPVRAVARPGTIPESRPRPG